jgi:hypothetical protein
MTSYTEKKFFTILGKSGLGHLVRYVSSTFLRHAPYFTQTVRSNISPKIPRQKERVFVVSIAGYLIVLLVS